MFNNRIGWIKTTGKSESGNQLATQTFSPPDIDSNAILQVYILTIHIQLQSS